jgi:2-(1,2-epoxy-1,2-dihydrophenyl)acetyl-CoA isomerase
MITNRVLSAAEALEWGLVTAVVPDAELSTKLDELAARIATGARKSNSAVKKLLLTTYASGFEEQLDHEARLISENADGADGREGIAAFLGKRTPEFTG